MTLLKLISLGAAAALLTAPSLATAAPKGDAPASQKPASASQPAPQSDDTVQVETEVSVDQDGKVINHTITNGPVPDTSENRAAYGGPNSNGGNATAPVGN